MNKISILDCTLRDGGYINDFAFGKMIISNMITKLGNANIEIIECGFLKSNAYDQNASLFGSVESIKEVIGEKKQSMYVAMIQYGAITLNEISDYDGNSIDGIRVTFHEHEIEDAFILAEGLMKKGYKVFVQPVGTTTYEDGSLIDLIKRVNSLRPYAFYIVDTLGTMYANDLLRLFYIVDHNLDKHIALGFHSHNNLQLSFSNAQELIRMRGTRDIIIDSSVLGMGRGAGNLNTELITQYLNINFESHYDQLEIMTILDEYIRPLSLKYKWGYEAAYYIAAVAACHPNYATFLLNRQTLNMQAINRILNGLSLEKRTLFDKDYILEKYLEYMDHEIDDKESLESIRKILNGEKVLLIAPGKSVQDKANEIAKLRNEGYCLISINYKYASVKPDLIFISNMKRFGNLESLEDVDIPLVVTSNIISQTLHENILPVNYSGYLTDTYSIKDNAGLMCINLVRKLGATDIVLAGFDGFRKDSSKNYYEDSMVLNVDANHLEEMNNAIANKIKQLRLQASIRFLGTSMYE